MAVDINKLSRGEQVIAVSGIALLIFSFFKWYGVGGGSTEIGGVEVDVPSVGINGWDRTLGMFAALIAMAQEVSSEVSS